MATRVSSSRFVGRAAELAELRSALADAAAGRPSLAFVAGESGVGKTRLVCEFEKVAREGGFRVLQGECVNLGDDELPYAPIVGAVRPLVRAGDPDVPAAVLDTMRGSSPAARGTSEEASGGRAQLFEALLTMVDRLAAPDGLVLVIEDLHWADRSTRAFLTYLAASLVSERVLVVATYRADELHRRHPLRPVLAELERTSGARRVDLAPFTHDELGQQLADILGSDADAGLVERLFLRSEGNALYAEELLAAGLDGRGALPPTLREALMLRIDRLEANTQEVLRALAITGSVEHPILAATVPLDSGALRDALRDGVAEQLVRVDAEGRYGLRHALLAEVIADDLLPGERADLHLQIGRAHEEHAPPGAHNASAIAHHYTAGGDQPRALASAVRAGAAAERVRAYGEAASLYERALELWDRVPDAAELAGTDRIDLLRTAAWCRQTDGDNERAESLLRAAVAAIDETAEPLRMAAVLDRLARQEFRIGRPDDAHATQDRALALLPEEPTAERALLLGNRAKHLALAARYREAAELARRALDDARAVGAELAEISAVDSLGLSLTWLGAEQGLPLLREGIALARERNLPMTALIIYVNLADSLLLAGRGREGLAAIDEGLEFAGGIGAHSRWLVLMKAEISFALGDWATARSLLPDDGRRLQANTLVNESHRRIELALGDGEHERVRHYLEVCDPILATSTETQFIGSQYVQRAELERRTGDLAAARAAVEEGLDRIEFCSEDRTRISNLSLAGMKVEADAAIRARDLGDAEAERAAVSLAEMLLARLEATAGEHRPVETANLATGRALMARTQDADDPEAWSGAVAAWQSVARPYEVAQAGWHRAEALLARGDREGAAATAGEALDGARAIGAGWLGSEVEGFMARARLAGPETERATNGDDPFGLTPRERQVLEMLASGATNREIGQSLYMAEKTASVHVSRILAKLDVRTRTEAAAVAHRLGLT